MASEFKKTYIVSGIPQSTVVCLLPHLSHGTKAGAKPCGKGTQCMEHLVTSWIKMPFSTQLPRALRSAGFHPPDAPEPYISSWQEMFTAKHLLPLREEVFTPVGLLKQVNFFVRIILSPH